MPSERYLVRTRSHNVRDSGLRKYSGSGKFGVYPSVLVSMVVARNGDKFCTTDEKEGRYLPAGEKTYDNLQCNLIPFSRDM